MIDRLIETHAQEAFNAGDNDAVLAVLNKPVPLPRSEALTWSGLAVRYAEAGFDALEIDQLARDVVSLVGGSLLDRMLSSGGCDFSLDSVQQQLAANISLGKLDAAFGARLQSIGVRQVSPAMQTLGRDATAKDVAAYRVQLAEQQFRAKVVNATALFAERMAEDSDAGEVMAKAWGEV